MAPLLLAGGGLGLLLLGQRPFLDLGIGALALAAIALATRELAAPFLGAGMFCTLASVGWLLLRRTSVLVVPTACTAPLVVHALGLPTFLDACLAVGIVFLGLRRRERGRSSSRSGTPRSRSSRRRRS